VSLKCHVAQLENKNFPVQNNQSIPRAVFLDYLTIVQVVGDIPTFYGAPKVCYRVYRTPLVL